METTREPFALHRLLTVGDVGLEPADCALSPDDSPTAAARAMLDDEAGFVPLCQDGRFSGAVFVDALLACVADDRIPQTLTTLSSARIPTCSRTSLLVDAVRTMIACYLRKIPVIGDDGELVGLLTLSEAAAAASQDPTVADVLQRYAISPSRFARWWR